MNWRNLQNVDENRWLTDICET